MVQLSGVESRKRRRAAMPTIGLEDRRNAHVARVFFDACTRVSPNTGDILPQEVRADNVQPGVLTHVLR